MFYITIHLTDTAREATGIAAWSAHAEDIRTLLELVEQKSAEYEVGEVNIKRA